MSITQKSIRFVLNDDAKMLKSICSRIMHEHAKFGIFEQIYYKTKHQIIMKNEDIKIVCATLFILSLDFILIKFKIFNTCTCISRKIYRFKKFKIII